MGSGDGRAGIASTDARNQRNGASNQTARPLGCRACRDRQVGTAAVSARVARPTQGDRLVPRSHARIQCSIWSDPDFVALGPESQRTYLVLLSQPDLSHCGVLPYLPQRWGRLAAGTNVETIEKAIVKLETGRYVVVDRDTAELLIRTLVVHDGGLANPKMRGAIRSALGAVHSKTLRDAVLDVVPDEYREFMANGSPIPPRSDRRSHPDPIAVVTPIRLNTEVGGRGKGRTSSGSASGGSARKRATPPPKDFAPDDELIAWAKDKTPGCDPRRETEAWLDWCYANGKTYRDHRMAWRTWMRKAYEFGRGDPLPSKNGQVPTAADYASGRY